MKNSILHIFLFCLLLGTPVAVSAMPNDVPTQEAWAESQSDVKIIVKGNTLRITGAAGQTLEIFSVTGTKVKTVKIGANDESINTGLPRGCYIVKVGDVVRKVSLG